MREGGGEDDSRAGAVFQIFSNKLRSSIMPVVLQPRVCMEARTEEKQGEISRQVECQKYKLTKGPLGQ